MNEGPAPSSALWRVLDSCVKSVTGVRGGRVLAVICVLVIGAATLFPTDAIGGERFLVCLICGDRGAADAILNTIMFVPLGISLALAGVGAAVAIPLCFVLSSTIEVIQFFVPGRDSSLGDLFFNTLGGAIGVAVVLGASRWVHPPDRVARGLGAVGVAFFGAVVALTGWLVAPTHPSAQYVVQWKPERYHLPPHPGEVVGVRMGTWTLPPESRWPWFRLRDAWNRGDSLVIRMRGATAPPWLSPVLSVHDVERREVLFVGDDGGELVVRPRFRAADARFDQPDLRLVGERRREGDSLTIVVARDGDGFLLGMGPKHRTVYNTASRGWGLLYYVESAPTKARTALGLLWIAALCVPAGFWARSRRAAVLASLGVIATLALIPMVTALGTTPPAEYVAAVAGVLIGRALAQVATRLRLGGESPGQPVASRVYRRA
jgi:hypothetical protein